MHKCIWLMGLSGSGKTTIAKALSEKYKLEGKKVILLDGDELRKGLNKDLCFSNEDRLENIRRAAEVVQLFLKEEYVVIVAMITPLQEMRAKVKEIIQENLILIYLSTPLSVCENRDPKGLYLKARSGIIKGFTGIDAPFEAPKDANIQLDTNSLSITQCLDIINLYVEK